jgi:DNA replication protein DnaC
MQYEHDKERCWYKEVCDLYGTEECYAGCIRYLEMFYLMEQSGLPSKRQSPILLIPQDIDEEEFEKLSKIKKRIVKFVETGENLYLYSTNSGNGKTTWAIKLLLSYFDKIWSGNGFECKGVFIHTPTFLLDLKKSISKPTASLETKLEFINSVPLVIWDDVVVSDVSNYDYNTLLSYIDQRIMKNLSNIYTSNLNKDGLEEIVGPRLASRLFNGSKYQIELKGQDRRSSFYNV